MWLTINEFYWYLYFTITEIAENAQRLGGLLYRKTEETTIFRPRHKERRILSTTIILQVKVQGRDQRGRRKSSWLKNKISVILVQCGYHRTFPNRNFNGPNGFNDIWLPIGNGKQENDYYHFWIDSTIQHNDVSVVKSFLTNCE